MGTLAVTIEIGDPEGQSFERMEALVDTGATLTRVAGSHLRRLGVVPTRRGAFRLASGQRVETDMG